MVEEENALTGCIASNAFFVVLLTIGSFVCDDIINKIIFAINFIVIVFLVILVALSKG
jgi:hypothetical protein